MKTQYYTASSLDGFIADAQHSLEWLFQFGSVADESYKNFIAGVGAIAMGSTTYEWILNHQAKEGKVGADVWEYAQPAWVFTSRILPVVEGANIKFVNGNVGPVHREMRVAAGAKNIWVVGGGELVGQFYDAGLLDEIFVQFASVTLGSGAPILPRRITSPPLKLLSVRAYGDAFAELHYEVSRCDMEE